MMFLMFFPNMSAIPTKTGKSFPNHSVPNIFPQKAGHWTIGRTKSVIFDGRVPNT